ncbi:MAG: type I-C CRISPR-associated protein Cas8c/Csd1 [Crenarchaeota archaeon]|nr:type I-C CRISPR-associated protein Cas8c/Csd1 [Thermoproteota archaeon]
MLLKHLYDYAHSRHLLDDLAFKRKTPVRWIIPLDQSGKLIGSGGIIETPSVTSNRSISKGTLYDVPKTSRSTNSGTVSDFLVDDIGAIFGLRTKLEKNGASGRIEAEKQAVIDKRNCKYADFWRLIETAYSETQNGDLRAILAFHKHLADAIPPFLSLKDDGTCWMVSSEAGEKKKLGSDFFSFQVDGRLVFIENSIRAYWKTAVEKELVETENDAQKGICLITGQVDVAIARTHIPMITGLPKTHKNDQIKSRGIIGFQSDSFCSYGFEQSNNAPVSVMASKAYLQALQFLTSHEEHWLPVGKCWFCFWVKSCDEYTSLFARLMKQPRPETVRRFLESPWYGLSHRPPEDDEFFMFAFTASGPRIVVKTWAELPLRDVAQSLQRWFRDLDIVSYRSEEDTSPLGLRELVSLVLPLKRENRRSYPDTDKLQPEIPSQLYRAALEGLAPPLSLIGPILNQLRLRLVGDKQYEIVNDQSRFALLKLILNRNRKDSDMEIKPQLIADTDDPAYNCGRLLSVLSETQKKAHDYRLEGAGVAERYFGIASVSPASVLPLLIRLNRHHLEKIRKSPKWGGDDKFLEDVLKALSVKFTPSGEKLPPKFPRTLNLQEQGRFALGFYQQQAEDARARIAGRVLGYLKETEPTAHAEVLALRESDLQAYYENVSQHYGSASFKEWSDNKRQKAKTSAANASDLFDNE